MDLNLSPRCHTCTFWTGDRRKPEGHGECHRFPPSPAGLVQQRNNITNEMNQAVVSAFSSISGMSWCGEYKTCIEIIS